MSTKALPLIVVDTKPLTKVLLVLSFCALTALSAHAKFFLPFTPVPITLQSMMVVLSGACLGPWLGMISQMLLITAGLVGLNVFSGDVSGLAILMGPTTGYIIGFMLCSWIAGAVSRAGLLKNWTTSFMILLATSLAIFIPGVIGLKISMNLSWADAVTKGFVPFIIGDFVKTALACSVWGVTNQWIRSRL